MKRTVWEMVLYTMIGARCVGGIVFFILFEYDLVVHKKSVFCWTFINWGDFPLALLRSLP